nr:uncharacterized protein LOC121132109 [Lepeophtheirus salmonis]
MPQFPKICSSHFTDENYERDLKNELLGKAAGKKLKKDTIPSLKLFNSVVDDGDPNPREDERDERLAKRQRREMLHQVMREVETKAKEDSIFDKTTSVEVKPEIATTRFQTVKDFHTKLLKNKIKVLQNQLQSLRESLNLYKKAYVRFKSKKSIKQLVRKELLKWHTPSQTNMLIAKAKSKTRWEKEDIINGLALNSLSSRTYKYIRDKKLFPLPSVTTLKRWIKDFETVLEYKEIS